MLSVFNLPSSSTKLMVKKLTFLWRTCFSLSFIPTKLIQSISTKQKLRSISSLKQFTNLTARRIQNKLSCQSLLDSESSEKMQEKFNSTLNIKLWLSYGLDSWQDTSTNMDFIRITSPSKKSEREALLPFMKLKESVTKSILQSKHFPSKQLYSLKILITSWIF